MTFDQEMIAINEEIEKMFSLTREYLRRSLVYYLSDESIVFDTKIDDHLVNDCERNVEAWCLSILLREKVYATDLRRVTGCLKLVTDIERIGDHAENLAEIAQSAIDGQVYFSEQGQNEISDMYNKVIASYSYALESMVTSDVNLACKVIKMEEQVDIMEESCRVNHMRRLNNNLCSIDNGIIYFEILANLERISDHAANIAEKVIQQKTNDK
jgi:phosphate:Na+ symporter